MLIVAVWVLWTYVAASTVATGLTSNGCVPPPVPPCNTLALYHLVVVADVLEVVDPPGSSDSGRSEPQRVKLRVVERFKGPLRQGLQATISITNRADAVFLKPGLRYLIFAARRDNGEWITSCSPTKEVTEDVGRELLLLRQCSAR